MANKNELTEKLVPEEEELEEEPTHSCCTRLLCVPGSIAACIPATAFVVSEVVSAPIIFILAVTCKMAICNFCCPESVHQCFRNTICTPCRWGRIAATGKGHIVCWKYPAWPFRGSAKKEEKDDNR